MRRPFRLGGAVVLGAMLIAPAGAAQAGSRSATDGLVRGARSALGEQVAGAGRSFGSLAQAPVGLRSAVAAVVQQKLTASDAASENFFGFSVAVSGSTAVVGAYAKNSGTGAAYVFVRSGSTWTQQAELTASDAVSGDVFGHSVAVSGSTVVVGAQNKNSTAGAAYVFVRSGSTWTQQAELTASDAASGDLFGFSVAVSGSIVVVGAPIKNSDRGAAYVFGQSGSTWTQQQELTASDAASCDHFGWSVSASGSTAVVGAPCKNSGTGAAYVFVQSGSTWTQQAELTASDAVSYEDFGDSVAVSGSTVVVGAEGKNSGTGAAYVFVQSGSTWTQQA